MKKQKTKIQGFQIYMKPKTPEQKLANVRNLPVVATAISGIVVLLWLFSVMSGVGAFCWLVVIWCIVFSIVKNILESHTKEQKVDTNKAKNTPQPASRAAPSRKRKVKNESKTAKMPSSKTLRRRVSRQNADIPKIMGPALDFDILPDRLIEIEYLDASGELSRRTVLAQRIHTERGGGIYIVGFCHLRQRLRSFRCDRITKISENGTETTVKQFLTDIGFYTERIVKESVAVNKLKKMVRNMADSDLDGFIEN